MTRHEKWMHLQDPTFFAQNRLPVVSDHRWYASEQLAQQGGKMDWRFSLDGSWRFYYCPNPDAVPEDFETADYDSSHWDSIKVPGHFELQGYGKPQYTDTRYPWDGAEQVAPHDVPHRYNPTGCYIREFTLPSSFAGMEIQLRMEGVETAYHCWLNGKYIGYSEDSYTPASFDITKLLQPGVNKLAIEVYRFCSGSWLEDQDFWRMGGIIREVALLAVPQAHMVDLDAVVDLGPDYNDGLLTVQMSLTDAVSRVGYTLSDPQGAPVTACDTVATNGRAGFALAVPQVHCWSAEQPHLYQLLLTVYNQDGSVSEVVPHMVGFRRVEIKNLQLLLNGKRLVFNGVNRHEFSAEKGRAIGEDEMLADIRLLKQNNITAVRTSHYPNQSLWYELCDRHGIYLMDEANLETHGTWHLREDFTHTLPGDDPKWTAACVDRARSMQERDKNHASVLVWSIGNESWGGSNLFAMSQHLRSRDSMRPIHYEGVCHDRRFPDTTDFESRMYATTQMAEEYMSNSPVKPYLLCEYAHSMGNSTGNLFKYTELAERFDSYCGGFIWDYIDQALASTDPFGKPHLAFGGDFGDRPTDNNFCTDGLVYADRTPSPKLQEVKFLFAPFTITPARGGVEIRSNCLFDDGSRYLLRYTLLREGVLVEQQHQPFCQPPQYTEFYPLPFALPATQGEYTLRVSMILREDAYYAPSGFEQAFGEYTFTQGEPQAVQRSAVAEVIDGDCTFSIVGDRFKIQYCKRFGKLTSLCRDNVELIQSPLHTLLPSFWRAITDNDEANGLKNRCASWKVASQYATVQSTVCKKTEDGGHVTTVYDLGNGALCMLEHHILGDGTIEVVESYTGTDTLPEMPCFGVSLKTPPATDVTYYGYGPEENYIDRCRGAQLGVYNTTPLASMSGYVIPQECGNHIGTRWVELHYSKGVGLRVESRTPFEFSALPYTCHELENAYHLYELPPVYATVLRINQVQMGVGGDNTWGARTHEEFLVPSAGEKRFAFTLRLI